MALAQETATETTDKYNAEAAALYEKYIEIADPIFRSIGMTRLVQLYKRTGERDKARAIAERQPWLSEGREFLLAELYEDDDSKQAWEGLYWELYNQLDKWLQNDALRARNERNTEKAIYLMEKCLALGEWLFDDPDERERQRVECGENWAHTGSAMSHQSLRIIAHSTLVRGFDCGSSTTSHPIEHVRALLTQERWNPVRDTPRFRAIVEAVNAAIND
jgi:hypothetical protein